MSNYSSYFLLSPSSNMHVVQLPAIQIINLLGVQNEHNIHFKLHQTSVINQIVYCILIKSST